MRTISEIIELVNRSQISSIKSVVQSIVRIINDPRSNAKDLKEIIELDPPLTGKVLRVANSTYYAPRTRIGEVMQAIVYIGFKTLKEMALSQKICDIFKSGDSHEGYSRVALWKHCVAVALMGKAIYRREFRERGENAYAAGLLHGIGLISEDQFFQEDFRSALTTAGTEEMNLADAERQLFGIDHAQIAMAIMEDWNLPDELVEAIGYHHEPEMASQSHSRIVSTVYVADYLVQREGIGFSDAPFENGARFERCRATLGVEVHALDMMLSDVKQEIADMEGQGLL